MGTIDIDSLGVVNEGSTAYLTVNFFDKTGAAATPSSISYRVDDVDSGTEVRPDTAFTPASSSIEITLDANDNAVVDATKDSEIREVTIEASYGADDKLNAVTKYVVKNAAFL